MRAPALASAPAFVRSPATLLFLALILSLLAALPARAAPFQVTFEVDLREQVRSGQFNPATDQLGIRGSQAPLSWQQSLPGRPLAGREGWWTVDVVFPQAPFGGQPVAYKFRIERAGQDGGQGWETGRNRALELVASPLKVARAFDAPAAPISLSRAGQIDVLPPLASRFVSARGIQVWLPPGYERDTQRRYPVLYLHDGQNLFDSAAAGAEWQVDETAQHLVVSGQIQPLIIVGVASNEQRVDDYTPTAGRMDGQTQGGKAPAYARYLIEELKPAIDARYRTQPDAGHTAVGGSSLGGLVSLWLALHHGDTFGAALVVSPSLWWDDQFALRDAGKVPLPAVALRSKLWLDMGTAEGEGNVKALRQLRQVLFNRGWHRGMLNYQEAEGAGHDEAAWAGRVPAMLLFLDRLAWPKTPLPASTGPLNTLPPAPKSTPFPAPGGTY